MPFLTFCAAKVSASCAASLAAISMDTSKGMVVIESCTVLCEIGMPGLPRRGSVLLLGLPLPFDGSICSREIGGACRHREVPARAAVVVMAVV